MAKRKGSLIEGSKSYHSEANYYEMFSKAEDYQKKIFKFLKPKIKGKIVLDVGCGNGRYASLLAPISKEYLGLDISKQQLKIAKYKTKKFKKIKFINCSAEKIPLKSEIVDIVISTWVISTIIGLRRKAKALKEAERILKKSGTIYIIENDSKGEFEEMRGHIKRTKKYHEWLKKKGFREMTKLNIYFKFNSFQLAKQTIESIWGKSVSKHVKSNIIKHNIIIFKKTK